MAGKQQELKLVGVAEVAELAGVERRTIHNWIRRSKDMPKPVANLACGPIWLEQPIREWLIKIGFTHLR